MGKGLSSLVMILLMAFVAFALGRSVVSIIRLARSPAADRREVSATYVLTIAALAALGIAAVVVGVLYANLFYGLLGAYVVFSAAHYYAVRRLP